MFGIGNSKRRTNKIGVTVTFDVEKGITIECERTSVSNVILHNVSADRLDANLIRRDAKDAS